MHHFSPCGCGLIPNIDSICCGKCLHSKQVIVPYEDKFAHNSILPFVSIIIITLSPQELPFDEGPFTCHDPISESQYSKVPCCTPPQISFHTRRIERRSMILRQRKPIKQPPRQIRIRSEVSSKSHKIDLSCSSSAHIPHIYASPTFSNSIPSTLRIIPTSSNKRSSLQNPPKSPQ